MLNYSEAQWNYWPYPYIKTNFFLIHRFEKFKKTIYLYFIFVIVAVVEVEDNRANSPTEKKLLNNTPNHKYNNINVITSTPKVNGVSISSNR